MSTAVPDVATRRITTLADLPFQINDRFPDRVILRQCRGDDLIDTSGREFFEQVRDVSLGLRELGVAPGDRVALMAESRPEWCVTERCDGCGRVYWRGSHWKRLRHAIDAACAEADGRAI